ncbi:MAG: peptide deformylase [bacterium]|nr:peptide deformylase [bacterium]
MAEFIARNHPVLRERAKEIAPSEIGNPSIKKLIKEMRKALHGEDDGVAIAAPQLGHALRLFVVSGRIFELKGKGGLEALAEGKAVPLKKKKGKPHPNDMVFVNPRIVKESKDAEWMVEGCLSLRWLYGRVKRKKRVTIEAYDERGRKFTRGAGGLLAQIFQHECDHLEGVLFTDKAKDVEDIPPELQREHGKTYVE